jgi:hypothetical protein
MDEDTHMDEPSLRREARVRIQQGVLPIEEPIRTWAGPGAGKPCSLCDRPIPKSETEFELEFRDAPDLRFHTMCHASWQLERLRHQQSTG